MTKDEAKQVIAVLMAAYPKTELPLESIQLYIQFLEDLPFEAGKAGALLHIAENKWFPTVSEIRQLAVNSIPGNAIPSASDAWGEVLKQIKHEGQYGIPNFSHPAIASAVKAMGWRNLCISEDGMADRAHFLKIYETYRNRTLQEQLQIPEVKKLVGAMQERLLEEQEKVALEAPEQKVYSLNDWKRMAREKGHEVV